MTVGILASYRFEEKNMLMLAYVQMLIVNVIVDLCRNGDNQRYDVPINY